MVKLDGMATFVAVAESGRPCLCRSADRHCQVAHVDGRSGRRNPTRFARGEETRYAAGHERSPLGSDRPRHGSGWKARPTPPPTAKAAVDAEKFQAIRDGLWLVVNGGGTGGRARMPGHDVAGKTGTAQVISNEGRLAARTTKDLRDNGWFVFFAPRDKPEIAGVVFLEHGLHGPNAASVARHILETYYAKKEGRPLPEPPADFHLDYKDPYARKTAPAAQN